MLVDCEGPSEALRVGEREQAVALARGKRFLSEQIDVSGGDYIATLAKERRRRAELLQAEELSELSAMLLPISIALARLGARRDVRGAVQ